MTHELYDSMNHVVSDMINYDDVTYDVTIDLKQVTGDACSISDVIDGVRLDMFGFSRDMRQVTCDLIEVARVSTEVDLETTHVVLDLSADIIRYNPAPLMPTEIDDLRELARAYWSGRPIPCPKHPGTNYTGSFVQTTFADHIFLTCPKGRETVTIPQRPRQVEFQAQQVEGMVENLQRGDSVLCYRCQSDLQVDVRENPTTGFAEYVFTCVRCFSYGTWAGMPELAKIGK